MNTTSRIEKVTASICSALLLAGCGKQSAKPPEKTLVRTALVESLDNVRSDGEASYLASVKFDHETDLNFKVGGIVVVIGPAANTDWDEGTPVTAGYGAGRVEAIGFQECVGYGARESGIGRQDS